MMTYLAHAEAGDRLRRVTDLLGGAKVFDEPVTSPLQAHRILLVGLPSHAVIFLIGELEVLDRGAAFERAIGFSARTLQRWKSAKTGVLSPDQSSRTWKFAELLAIATETFGSQKDAEVWMQSPVMALDGARPIDLLATAAGTEMVETHLQRLEYGVYA